MEPTKKSLKVFEFLLSGPDETVALVVAAKSEEHATKLIAEDYNLIGDDEEIEDEEEREGRLSVYRSNEITSATSTQEFVIQIFSTNEL